MASIKEQVKSRAKQVLFADKLVSPNMFKETLKLESYNMLSQFMDITPQNLKISIVVEPTGQFKITMVAVANKIKPIGVVVK